jgi:3-phosphoshikimate 1-carboxyvinyltransferase
MTHTVTVAPLRAGLRGSLRVPGDKSVSHRAIMLASLAQGTSRVSGFLEGEDTRNTARAFAQMGVRIETPSANERIVHGVGLHGLRAPESPLDLGNAGTGMRLIAGVMAGQKFASTLTGDASLSARPMKRVTVPLRQMGAKIEARDGDFPPLTFSGGADLRGIDYASPVASAQVKSCVLLAGLYAKGDTRVTEPVGTRDYTETMLTRFGVDLTVTGSSVLLREGAVLRATDVEVPGDFSSAAFWIVAATVVANSDLTLIGVGLNRFRLGLIEALRAMGADIQIYPGDDPEIGAIRVRSAELKGITLDPAIVPNMIDEFPAFFVAASVARGVTRISGAEELRVKESDRIAVMAAALRTIGAEIEERHDGAEIRGVKQLSGDAHVESGGDHRCAMSMAVAACISAGPISIHDCANVATSYPTFWESARTLGISLED